MKKLLATAVVAAIGLMSSGAGAEEIPVGWTSLGAPSGKFVPLAAHRWGGAIDVRFEWVPQSAPPGAIEVECLAKDSDQLVIGSAKMRVYNVGAPIRASLVVGLWEGRPGAWNASAARSRFAWLGCGWAYLRKTR